ncbi:sensor histidine kinase [candidate division KSB1 bacterium]|nr:MAG: sensor histidine kinase [candidate division KSB1 bacterium]MBC6949892.1 sensor histidine kinase [candidate division KSB1 bacterium]MCE7943808.1 sensor histidine kinase [Chlorobi bacterium CHB1]MDL1876919.1 sensor histidine kinase [Cytophagia bacterium CHB2]
MHPLLAHKNRLGLYLIAWVLMGVLLAALVKFMANLPWLEALVLALPLTMIYSFMCLPPWYLCREFPLTQTPPVKLALVYVVAAILSSASWLALGKGWSLLLARPDFFPSLAVQYEQVLPLFAGVGLMLFWLSVVGHYLVIAFETVRLNEKQALELQILAHEAELKALRAQIHPHFLFNSLNSISALTTIDPAAARLMCLRLADFLRQSLNLGAQDKISLAQELALAQDFLAIEQIRFGQRLQVAQNIAEESTACEVPPLLLQPLLENAINHGIAHLLEGGTITLEALRNGSYLKLAVQNPCDPERPSPRRAGIGLANVKKRLFTLFGADARVDIIDNTHDFRVELSLPARP